MGFIYKTLPIQRYFNYSYLSYINYFSTSSTYSAKDLLNPEYIDTGNTTITISPTEFSMLDNAVGNIQDQINNINNNNSQLSTDVVNVQADISILETGLASANTKITTLQGQMTTANTNITTANTNIATNKTNITTLQGQMTTANNNIATANTNIATNTSNITTLQGQMTTANNNITTLQGQITTANNNISNLSGGNFTEINVENIYATNAVSAADFTIGSISLYYLYSAQIPAGWLISKNIGTMPILPYTISSYKNTFDSSTYIVLNNKFKIILYNGENYATVLYTIDNLNGTTNKTQLLSSLTTSITNISWKLYFNNDSYQCSTLY